MSIEVSFSNVLLVSDVRGREKFIELTLIAKKKKKYRIIVLNLSQTSLIRSLDILKFI